MPDASVHAYHASFLRLEGLQLFWSVWRYFDARGPVVGAGDVEDRAVLLVHVAEAEHTVHGPRCMLWIWNDDALVTVQRHGLEPWSGDVGGEVADEEVFAQNRLDHVDGDGVLD